LAGDAAVAWAELNRPKSGKIHIVANAEALARHSAALEADLIVDAVLGTGFKPPLKGLALAACEWLRQSRAAVLAVDLPSGWPADETSATAAGPALHPSDKDLSPGAPVFPADAVIT